MYLFANPLLVRLIDLIPRPVGNLLVWVLLILLTVDFLGSWAALVQLNGELKEPSEISGAGNGSPPPWTTRSPAPSSAVWPRPIPVWIKSVSAPSARPIRCGTARYCRRMQLLQAGLSLLYRCFLGDIIETIFCRATAGVWMSRSSVVYGPFSIVWGLGAVLLTAVLYRYRDRSDSFVFLFGTVLGGAYEYVCSVFTELVFGTVFWDYSHLPFNLGGRINLLFCFFWGIAAVVWLKLCYPRLSGLIERLPIRLGKRLTWIMIVFMVINILVSALALARYTQRHTMPDAPPTALSQLLDQRFPDERMEHIYPNAKLVD